MAIKTLKASGGDYTTIAAWLASLPATLTEPEQLEVYDFDMDIGAASVSISKTTSAANYIRIYAAPGQGHDGRPRDVSAKGFRLINNVAGPTININANHVRLEGFEIYNTSTSTSSQAFSCMNFTFAADSDIRLANMLIHDSATDTSYTVNVSRANLNIALSNCIVYGTRRSLDTRNAASAKIENCTFWRHTASLGVLVAAAHTVRNTYSGHAGAASDDFWTGSTPVGSNNIASDTTASPRFTASLNSVAGASVFASVTAGSENFNLLAGTNALVDAGTAIGAITTDSIGTARPQGAAYDVGAIERPVVSGTTINATTGKASAKAGVANIATSVTVLATTAVASAKGLVAAISNPSASTVSCALAAAAAKAGSAVVATVVTVSPGLAIASAQGKLAAVSNSPGATINTLVAAASAKAGVATVSNLGPQFVTSQLVSSLGAIQTTKLVYYSWFPAGRIGSFAGITPVEGTTTTNSSGVAACPVAAAGPGLLMLAVRASGATTDEVYYEAGNAS